jgi:hypothetical protein
VSPSAPNEAAGSTAAGPGAPTIDNIQAGVKLKRVHLLSPRLRGPTHAHLDVERGALYLVDGVRLRRREINPGRPRRPIARGRRSDCTETPHRERALVVGVETERVSGGIEHHSHVALRLKAGYFGPHADGIRHRLVEVVDFDFEMHRHLRLAGLDRPDGPLIPS